MMEVSMHGGTPIAGWFIMEHPNPMKIYRMFTHSHGKTWSGGVIKMMAPKNHPSHGWPWFNIETHGDLGIPHLRKHPYMYLSHHIPLYSFISHYRGISIHWCTQIAGWFIIEKTIKLDDLGVSPFQEYIYIYILIITYIHTILSHYIPLYPLISCYILLLYYPLYTIIISHFIPFYPHVKCFSCGPTSGSVLSLLGLGLRIVATKDSQKHLVQRDSGWEEPRPDNFKKNPQKRPTTPIRIPH